jgi:pimeloyl-ACP methyl ester carboxylesterase
VKHSYADARPSGTPFCDEPVAVADGRRVQVAQWGELGAAPVLFLHGQPGSRLFCPDLAATEQARVHLITFDRAGYGRSDPAWTNPSYRSSVNDAVAVLDHLDIDRAAVIGYSGGGPHALALGALAVDRVTTVTTVCSTSGPDTLLDEDPDVRVLTRAVCEDPAGARDQVRVRARTVLGDRTWVTRMTERFDPTVYEAPQMRELYQANWDEATVSSIEGYVDDWILSTLPWDFDLADLRVPVYVWYGEGDVIVPQAHAATIAARTQKGQVFACPQCRHYVPVAHWPEILEHALQE